MEIKQLKEKFIEIYGGSEDDLRVFRLPEESTSSANI